MDTRVLGDSDLWVTRVGLGTAAFGGGDWVGGWGPQTDAESRATVRRALELGINWIDTAAVYGLGRSETVIGRALQPVPLRERPYIFTRCGPVWDELGNVTHDLRPDSIRRQVEASLGRLGVNHLDLLQLGPPDAALGWHSGALEEGWDAMAALQREGLVRYIGLSNGDAEQLARLQRIAPMTCLQTRCSALHAGPDDTVRRLCDRHGIGIVASSSLESGLLAGTMTKDRLESLPHNDWRRRSTRFRQSCDDRAGGLLERIREVANRHGRTPAQIAVAWALHHPALTAVAVGARRPAQVEEIVGGAAVALTAEDLETIGRPDRRIP
jgi:aryl-alcohol dehydrogenase-like predicted oxidoreductase